MSDTGKTITISKEAYLEIKRLNDKLSDYQQDMAVLAGENEALNKMIDELLFASLSDVKAKERENAALVKNWAELMLFAKEHDADKFLYVEASEFIKKMEELEGGKG